MNGGEPVFQTVHPNSKRGYENTKSFFLAPIVRLSQRLIELERLGHTFKHSEVSYRLTCVNSRRRNSDGGFEFEGCGFSLGAVVGAGELAWDFENAAGFVGVADEIAEL